MDHKEAHHLRLYVLAALFFIVAAVYIGVLYDTQVNNYDYYYASSVRSIARSETVEAARGDILDRYGRVLVSNRVTYQVALNTDAIMNLILAVNPDIDTIGLLYDLSQDASTQAIADAKAFCDSKGIQYIEKNGTTTAEVQMAAEALVAAGVKAVFTPTDNTVMTAELSIYETFTDAGIMHFTGADSFALNGAFVGYGVDYVQLGEATADMVVELLCEGKTTADLPYQTFDNGIVTINTETAAALGMDDKTLDMIKEAFKPYCTEITEVTTAENFS